MPEYLVSEGLLEELSRSSTLEEVEMDQRCAKFKMRENGVLITVVVSTNVSSQWPAVYSPSVFSRASLFLDQQKAQLQKEKKKAFCENVKLVMRTITATIFIFLMLITALAAHLSSRH